MTIKKLGLALAVSALASTTNAALYVAGDDAGNTGGSSLLFAAYDASTQTALYVDLNALHANNRVHTFDQNASQSIDLNAVAAANNFSLAEVQWTVVAEDAVFLGGTCSGSLADLSTCGQFHMATVSDAEIIPTTASANLVSSIINSVNNGWFLNIRGTINSGNGHSTTVVDGSFGQWSDGLVPAQHLWDVTGSTGETLAFAMATITGSRHYRVNVVMNPYTSIEYLPGTWTLSETGTLSYAAVPVPVALWLFASGLVGLAGMVRRRKLV